MNGRDITELGYAEGKIVGLALRVSKRAIKLMSREALDEKLKSLLASPRRSPRICCSAILPAPSFRSATALIGSSASRPRLIRSGAKGLRMARCSKWPTRFGCPSPCAARLCPTPTKATACRSAACSPVENAVIPYAVGVDIACRMKLSVLDIPADKLDALREKLVNSLHRETLFGAGAGFKRPPQHDVLDEDWNVTPVTKRVFEKAAKQLGTSGSGNHFVEYGLLEINMTEAQRNLKLAKQSRVADAPQAPSFDLPNGTYLASPFPLRFAWCRRDDRFALFDARADAPSRAAAGPSFLSWLDMNSEPGQEYFAAMNLMGHYAHANHAIIHDKVTRAIGARVIGGVENHHNFAWKEVHDGRELYVHRKGATPAGVGVLGMIPGSMASPGFVVRGKGVAASLDSASHGAGRRMSRTAARNQYRWAQIKPMLEELGVQLLSAGIDENPFAYKNIEDVMRQQSDLVDVVARFDPKIVRMAPDGEKPED